MFDRDMILTQAGNSIARIIPRLRSVLPCDETDSSECTSSAADAEPDVFDLEEELKMNDLFDLARPPMPFSFHHIQSQINQVFVLRTKLGKYKKKLLTLPLFTVLLSKIKNRRFGVKIQLLQIYGKRIQYF